MFDLLTHCTDTKLLLAEYETVFPELVNKDTGSINFDKTFTHRKGNETLSLMRVNSELANKVRSMKSLNVLVDVPANSPILKNMSVENKVIYDRVYDTTPVAILDEKGKPVLDDKGVALEYTPPELFCSFGGNN